LHAVILITLLLHVTVAFWNIPSYNHPQVNSICQIWNKTLHWNLSKHIIWKLVLSFVISYTNDMLLFYCLIGYYVNKII